MKLSMGLSFLPGQPSYESQIAPYKWACPTCGQEFVGADTDEHRLWCKVYESLRRKADGDESATEPVP